MSDYLNTRNYANWHTPSPEFDSPTRLHTNHKETEDQVPCQLQLHGARPISVWLSVIVVIIWYNSVWIWGVHATCVLFSFLGMSHLSKVEAFNPYILYIYSAYKMYTYIHVYCTYIDTCLVLPFIFHNFALHWPRQPLIPSNTHICQRRRLH